MHSVSLVHTPAHRSVSVSTCCIMHFSHSEPMWDMRDEVKMKGWMRQCGEVHSVCWLQVVLPVGERQRAPLGIVGLWLRECKWHTQADWHCVVYSISHRWLIWDQWGTKSVKWPSTKLSSCHCVRVCVLQQNIHKIPFLDIRYRIASLQLVRILLKDTLVMLIFACLPTVVWRRTF